MKIAREVLRTLAIPLMMIAFLAAAQLSAGLSLRSASTMQTAALR